MKIHIIVEHNSLTSDKTTEEIIDDIASMVEKLQERHYPTIDRNFVEVTITEKR